MTADIEYTGDVSTDSPKQVRILDKISITKFAVGDMANNVYIVQSLASGARLLIDAADSPETILAALAPLEPHLPIVTTHSHADHHQALAAVTQQNSAVTYAGRDDADSLPIEIDRLLDHGDVLEIDDLHFEILGIRGHTPGSIAIVYREPRESTAPGRAHIFTGDSLFPGGLGHTESGEDFKSLFSDVKNRIFDNFNDDTWIYPGHGRDTTLGVERPHLDEWEARGW